MKIETLVICPGQSVVVDVVKESAKAVQVKNAGGSPDNHGRTCWLPKSALKPDPVYSDGGRVAAYRIAPWLVRKLDRFQRRALDLEC